MPPSSSLFSPLFCKAVIVPSSILVCGVLIAIFGVPSCHLFHDPRALSRELDSKSKPLWVVQMAIIRAQKDGKQVPGSRECLEQWLQHPSVMSGNQWTKYGQEFVRRGLYITNYHDCSGVHHPYVLLWFIVTRSDERWVCTASGLSLYEEYHREDEARQLFGDELIDRLIIRSAP